MSGGNHRSFQLQCSDPKKDSFKYFHHYKLEGLYQTLSLGDTISISLSVNQFHASKITCSKKCALIFAQLEPPFIRNLL